MIASCRQVRITAGSLLRSGRCPGVNACLFVRPLTSQIAPDIKLFCILLILPSAYSLTPRVERSMVSISAAEEVLLTLHSGTVCLPRSARLRKTWVFSNACSGRRSRTFTLNKTGEGWLRSRKRHAQWRHKRRLILPAPSTADWATATKAWGSTGRRSRRIRSTRKETVV